MVVSIGIDYSMTCPAACAYSDDGNVQFWYAHESKAFAFPNVTGVSLKVVLPTVSKRAARIAEEFLIWQDKLGTPLGVVHIEDYAFAATGRVFHIGENTGILKHYLDGARLEYECVPPTVVKKFATGKGNADKIKMTQAFLAEYPAARTWTSQFFPRSPDGDLEPVKWAKSPLADLADAYWIAKYAASLTSQPV